MQRNRHEFFNGSSLNIIMRAAIQVLLRHGQLFCHVKLAPTIYLATKKVEQSLAKGKGQQSRHGLNPMDMSTNLKWSLFPD